MLHAIIAARASALVSSRESSGKLLIIHISLLARWREVSPRGSRSPHLSHLTQEMDLMLTLAKQPPLSKVSIFIPEIFLS